jgi:hypothetical protein
MMKFHLFSWFGARGNNQKKIECLTGPGEFGEPCAREDDQKTCKRLTELCCCFITKDFDQQMLEQNLARARAHDRQWPMDKVLELCEEVNRWDREMNQ